MEAINLSQSSSGLYEATPTERNRYQAILEGKIREGTQRAIRTIESVFANVPDDRIIRSNSFRVSHSEEKQGLTIAIDDQVFSHTDWSLQQIASRGNMPPSYLRQLAMSMAPWERELAAHIVRENYFHADDGRILVRTVGAQLRGWLSDRFRRLDSRPLVEALAQVAVENGGVPFDGSATETRVALKVIVPEVIEPVPGEYMVRGLEWSNSDFGNGTNAVRAFALRVACLNGMTREDLVRQVHLGGRLADNIAWSDRTYQLDTEASVSALRDVVRGALGPAGLASIAQRVQELAARPFTTAQLSSAVKSTGKTTAKAIVDAWGSQDVINLPAGQTAWRASNAISWIARHTESDETRLDLERLAGSIGGAN